VGTEFNEAADDLATRAAFNFDAVPYQRFRAAQAATGREMPHPEAEVAAPQSRARPASSPDGPVPARVEDWVNDADYALVVYACPDNNGRTLGRFALFTRGGRSRVQTIHDGRLFSPDEADYHVLIAALTDLCARVTAREHDPGTYALTLYSHRELVVKQLSGVYKVRAPALRPLYTEARGLLDRFKQADLVWRRDDSIKALLRSGTG
jgi:ribonuclease HI